MTEDSKSIINTFEIGKLVQIYFSNTSKTKICYMDSITEDDLEEGRPPNISFTPKTKEIQTKPAKIFIDFSNNTNFFDILSYKDIACNAIIKEIENSVTKQIIKKMFELGEKHSPEFNKRYSLTTCDNSHAYISVFDFVRYMHKYSTSILAKTRTHQANFIICNIQTFTILKEHDILKPLKIDNEHYNYKSFELVGTIAAFDVYVDYTLLYEDNRIILGRSNDNNNCLPGLKIVFSKFDINEPYTGFHPKGVELNCEYEIFTTKDEIAANYYRTIKLDLI